MGDLTSDKCCLQMREACHQQDQARCLELLSQANSSFSTLKENLLVFLQLDLERKRLGSQRL